MGSHCISYHLLWILGWRYRAHPVRPGRHWTVTNERGTNASGPISTAAIVPGHRALNPYRARISSGAAKMEPLLSSWVNQGSDEEIDVIIQFAETDGAADCAADFDQAARDRAQVIFGAGEFPRRLYPHSGACGQGDPFGSGTPGSAAGGGSHISGPRGTRQPGPHQPRRGR